MRPLTAKCLTGPKWPQLSQPWVFAYGPYYFADLYACPVNEITPTSVTCQTKEVRLSLPVAVASRFARVCVRSGRLWYDHEIPSKFRFRSRHTNNARFH